MKAFTIHSGSAVALYQPNIDTDQIIPKQFLKRIERTGYGEFLFYDWRFNADGTERVDFILNNPKYKDASVLLAGANFGCGSSREHAPWSLTDYGFRVVIAPSFADIFYNNSLKNGLLPVVLSEEKVAELAEKSQTPENYELTIDLENQTLSDGEGFEASFEINEFRKYCLLNGLDDIGLTLQNESKISEYEIRREKSMPFAAF
ncbi:MAG TPA: 3-isopropylmalate dehydratase small subunit [Pyrinomonadaceae bacterium]|jgi:3-isopropylmalate/(R)-2-methylmalate dehydratase small subunit